MRKKCTKQRKKFVMTNATAQVTKLENENHFDIPVALFLFLRIDKPLKIIEVLKKIKPTKLYLISDGGRNADEINKVLACRRLIEESINWECEVVKKYHNYNVGVHENIGGGALWVLKNERWAIFLEDDNLPEVSFFEYCKELLYIYENHHNVLWICGTNYLVECSPVDSSSYFFSQNMLPCGWASWSNKFVQYYDVNLQRWNEAKYRSTFDKSYKNKKLFLQDVFNIEYEIDAKKTGRFYSWDYHMTFSIRAHDLVGIVPKVNLIKNIGVDFDSTHGGTSLSNEMTSRFCELNIIPMKFPLKHPSVVAIDTELEERIAQKIIDPAFFSIRSRISRALRKMFKIKKNIKISEWIKGAKS